MLFVAVILAISSYSFGQSIGIGATQCDAPHKVGISAVTPSSVSVNWVATTDEIYMVEVGEPGFVPGTGNMLQRAFTLGQPNEVNEVTVDGLPSRTTLFLYIQKVCDESSSNWVGPIKFHTGTGFSTTK